MILGSARDSEFCGSGPGFLMRPGSRMLASSNRQSVRFSRAFWSSADVQGIGFCDRVLCASLGVVDADVLVEVLLRNSVEGKRGNRTLQVRSRHTPCAVGAAPATEVVAVDPDQVFVHRSICLCARVGLELGLRWVGHQASESHPSPMGNLPWNHRAAKYQRSSPQP